MSATDTRAVVQQLVDVLEQVRGDINPERGYAEELESEVQGAYTKGRALLAALPEQPVGVQEFWLVLDETGNPMHPATNSDDAHQFIKEMQNEFLDEPAHLAAISQWTVVKVVVS